MAPSNPPKAVSVVFLQGLAIDFQDDLEPNPSVASANSSKDNVDSEDETQEVTDNARGKQKHTRADSKLEETTSRDSGSSSAAAKDQQTSAPVFAVPLASRPPVDVTASSSRQPPLTKKVCRRFDWLIE